jgi:hypothetical protein
LGPIATSIDYVLAYTGHMESSNLVALTVAELDNSLPRFMDDRRDSVWATHGLPGEVFAWKMALG